MKSSNHTQQKWYQRTWVILLSLVFILPVGIVLAWKSKWSQKSKIIASVYTVLATVFVVAAFVLSPPTIEVANMAVDKTPVVEDASYKIEGKIYPYDSELTVNGEKVATHDQGKFITTVQLREGQNAIKIVAKSGDKTTEKTYNVKRLSAAEIAEAKRIAQEKADKAKQQADAAAKAKADADAKAGQQKPTTTPAPTPKPQPQKTTIDKLWKASDSVLKTRDGVDIQFDASIGTAQLYVTRKSDSFLDEKDVVRTTYTNFVLWGQKVNSLPGVQTVDVFTKTNFTDSYGKESTQTAVRVTMDSSKFRQYDWNGLKYQPIHTQLQTNGTLYLYPAIRANVNLNDVKLSF